MKNMQYIEEIITKNMQNMHIPGLSLAVIDGPEICYIQGFGANHSQMPEQKVTPETLFCIGSVTKPLVATAIMRLVEQNKLDLDESIVRYLPFPVRDELTSITMRMLLAHTAGFPTVNVPVNQKKAQSLFSSRLYPRPNCAIIADIIQFCIGSPHCPGTRPSAGKKTGIDHAHSRGIICKQHQKLPAKLLAFQPRLPSLHTLHP